MTMPTDDCNETIARYKTRYSLYGYSPKTLGWDKGKQRLRFQALTEHFRLEGSSVLDIGCGFGDLNQLLAEQTDDYRYVGIDLVDDLISKAAELYAAPNRSFITGDFLRHEFTETFDYVVASGMFNHKLKQIGNDAFIEGCMRKAFRLCREAIAFDFLSDKVDYRYDHTHHSSPEAILSMAYRLSRNVILRNDYMPFEFSIIVFKDDSFHKENTIFRRIWPESEG